MTNLQANLLNSSSNFVSVPNVPTFDYFYEYLKIKKKVESERSKNVAGGKVFGNV